MGKKILFAVLLFGMTAVNAAPALAFNQRITVYAQVLPQRVIYLDVSGNITKVAGNTVDNIEPQIIDKDNQPVPATERIQQQYLRFLESYGNHLEASKVYSVNPIAISLAPNTQTIRVSSPNLTLVSLKVD